MSLDQFPDELRDNMIGVLRNFEMPTMPFGGKVNLLLLGVGRGEVRVGEQRGRGQGTTFCYQGGTCTVVNLRIDPTY